MLYDGTRWSGILTFCGFVLFLSQSLRVSESRESRESQSLGNVIFNILESHVFKKYSTRRVLLLSLPFSLYNLRNLKNLKKWVAAAAAADLYLIDPDKTQSQML